VDPTGDSSDAGATATIELDPGETVTCTFTNTERGKIVIKKVTDPAGGTGFDFTDDIANPNSFTLDDGQSETFLDVLPGTYAVTETVPSGWDLTDLVCVDPTGDSSDAGATATTSGWDLTDLVCVDPTGDSSDAGATATIELDPGETVTCTYTNTELGSITIIKDAIPADETDFRFALGAVPGPAAPFYLDDADPDDRDGIDDTKVFANLLPGQYGVSETVPPNWSLTGIDCVGSESITTTLVGAVIDLGAGENVTCTFTNAHADARIGIVGTATNEVDAAHTFTVTVEKKEGDTWSPAQGVTVTITFPGGAPGTVDASDCEVNGSDASGVCLVTINSKVAGIFDAHAKASIPVFQYVLVRETDGQGGNSKDAVKTYVDARISIVDSAVNEVGDSHTFTVTIGMDDGTGWSPAQGVTVTITFPGGAPGTVDASDCEVNGTDADGVCLVTINSDVAGIFTVHAKADILVGGLTLVRETDGQGDNSEDAVKTYVDARISIEGDGTNEVGDEHTFTVTVEEKTNGVWVPVAGAKVVASATGVGSITGGTCETGVTDANGQCTVLVNSTVPGQTTVSATSDLIVDGVDISVSTPEPGVKTWVDAWISIGESAVNEVGDLHTFTVTIKTHDGSAWSPAVGVAPTITFPGVQPGSSDLSDCAAGTGTAGTCVVTVNSNVAGVFSVHAAADIPVGGLTLTRQTDGQGDNSEEAVKTYVDAAISIGDSAINQVGDPHIFTITVTKHDGSAWAPADDGVKPVITFLGDSPDVLADTCADPGTVAGLCQITINSSVSGVFTAHAAAHIPVGGLTLFRETDGLGNNSGDAVKTYFGPNVSIIKTAGDAADGEVYEIHFSPDPVLVTFDYLVTNTGDTYLSDLTITDDRGTPADTGDDEVLTKADCPGLEGPLAPGESVDCTAEFLVDGDETNIAVVIGNPTDEYGDDLPGMDDPTDDDDAIVDMDVAPEVAIDKRLIGYDIDAEWPNYVTFTIAIENVGPSTIDILPLEDVYDKYYLSFQWADPMPEEPLDDGQVNWYDLTAEGANGFGVNLAHGEVFTLTTVFMVVNDITSTTNLAIVREAIDVYGNTAPDVEDEELIIGVPTAVELLYFRAAPAGDMILLEWETAMEVDNWGFNLYRGLTPDLGSAEWIHFEPGMGWGQFDGRQYQYLDPYAGSGQAVYYWLEDVDLSDRTHLLSGPVITTLAAQYRIFLPMVLR
jgi:hypothetical protein